MSETNNLASLASSIQTITSPFRTHLSNLHERY
jgi:hypothetical protein